MRVVAREEGGEGSGKGSDVWVEAASGSATAVMLEIAQQRASERAGIDVDAPSARQNSGLSRSRSRKPGTKRRRRLPILLEWIEVPSST